MRLPSLGPNSAAVVGLTGFYASLACAVMGIYAIDALSPSTFRIVMGLSAMLAAPTFLVAVRARSDGRAGLASVTLAVGSGIVLGALASWLVQHDVGQDHVLSIAGVFVGGPITTLLAGGASGGIVSAACALAMTHVVSAARNPAMGFDHDTRLLVPIFGAAAVAAGLAAALTPRAHLWAPAAALVVAWLGLGASTLRERARLGIVGRIYRGEEAGIRLVHDADARRLAEVLPVVALAAPEVLAVEEEAASYRRNAYEGSLFVLTHDPRKTLGPLRARTRLGAACGVVSVLLVGLRVVLL